MDNFKSSDDVLAAINDLANGIPEGGGEEQERYSFPEVLPDPVEQYLDDDGRQEVDRLESDANLREQWKADETARMQHEYAMTCLLYTSPSPRDRTRSRMPSSA